MREPVCATIAFIAFLGAVGAVGEYEVGGDFVQCAVNAVVSFAVAVAAAMIGNLPEEKKKAASDGTENGTKQ